MQPTTGASHTIHIQPAETTQKTALGMYLRSPATNMGFNPVGATITLTNQRLRIVPQRRNSSFVGQTFAALGVLDPVDFPLCHIRSVEISTKAVWGKRDVLGIEFDNDGREYLWVQPAQEWQAAIEAARATANDMPYSTLPAVKHGVETSTASSMGKVLLALFGVVLALTLACGLIGALVGLMR